MANSTFFLGISALTAAFAIITLSFGPVAAAEKIISANEAYDLSVKNQLMVIDIRSPKDMGGIRSTPGRPDDYHA
jgi:hypothetical protein